MRFPGRRKSKHYFPVAEREMTVKQGQKLTRKAYIVGIDQTLVDIEARVEPEFLERYGLQKGQSLLIDDQSAENMYQELKQTFGVVKEFAGGTIGNTLHNYSTLADDRSVLLGAMSRHIEVGSYGYRYLCNTSSRVDLNFLQPVDGPIGRCFTLVSTDGDRSFGINGGLMNHLAADSVPEELIKHASALVITAYLMRTGDGESMTDATMEAIQYANKYDVPVVLTLGTRHLIEQDPQFWRDFVNKHVTVLAMNEEEARALTGHDEPVAALNDSLDWVDFALLTAGPEGLYTAGYTDESIKRPTKHPLMSAAVAEFNEYEFSRPMLKADCPEPLKVFSHISPYMGGPEVIKNTNGAGDGALSAILHDLASNKYHRDNVPNSSKHKLPYLTYSSFSQLCKYANRVSFEVLSQHGPRLSRGLPEKEDSLEESYWEW